MKTSEVKTAVRERYGRVAAESSGCCGSTASCGTGVPEGVGKAIGYTEADLKAAPEGSNLGLGCGNPVALSSLKPGETVLDLGSGAGFDCFLAAERVGPRGRVIGVDMTPGMIDRARENARTGGRGNVEFRLGEIENLPAADGSVDAVISNCVINLSPDKPRVFREAFRVLKPGGRMIISDIVLLKDLPARVRDSVAAYTGCVAGALKKQEYLDAVARTGFEDVRVEKEVAYPAEVFPEELRGEAVSIASVTVSGTKPAR